ncbi:MAG: type II 3-dehydroquinate dehydratase, partial [Flavobacterium sp.]
HQSFISPVAAGVIIGFGLKSYELALHSLIK